MYSRRKISQHRTELKSGARLGSGLPVELAGRRQQGALRGGLDRRGGARSDGARCVERRRKPRELLREQRRRRGSDAGEPRRTADVGGERGGSCVGGGVSQKLGNGGARRWRRAATRRHWRAVAEDDEGGADRSSEPAWSSRENAGPRDPAGEAAAEAGGGDPTNAVGWTATEVARRSGERAAVRVTPGNVAARRETAVKWRGIRRKAENGDRRKNATTAAGTALVLGKRREDAGGKRRREGPLRERRENTVRTPASRLYPKLRSDTTR